MLLCFSGACFLLAVHYALLEQWTALYIELIALARFVISIFTTRKAFKLAFHSLACVVGAITFNGLHSLLPVAAAFLQTEAAYTRNDKSLRQLMMGGTLAMIVYNAVIGSPAAVVLEAFFLSSNLIGYYRYYLKPNTI